MPIFQPPEANAAPFTLTDDNGNVEANSLRFDSNIVELRNVVFVRGGEYKDPISEADATDKYESNGEDNTFPLVYRYTDVEITRNAVAQTVGVDYIDNMFGDILSLGDATGTTANKLVSSTATFVTDGVAVGDQVFNSTDETYAVVTNVDSETQLTLNKDIFVSGEAYTVTQVAFNCMYNYQEKLVKFPDGTLDDGDIIRVFGDANVPLIVQAVDSDSIIAFGEREGVEIDKSITSIEEAELLANSLLEKWKEGSLEGKFTTRETGLRVGQYLTITSTRFGVDAMYRVNKVRGTLKHLDAFEWKIEFLTSGQTKLTDILISLIGKDNQNVEISPNEVIQKFRQVVDAFSFSDEIVSVTSDSAPYHYGPVTAGNEGLYNFATYT
jgi:hypothetical protein